MDNSRQTDDWTKDLVLIQQTIRRILIHEDKLDLGYELRIVDSMLESIPYEPSRVIYEDMVERKLGHFYNQCNDKSLGQWRKS